VRTLSQVADCLLHLFSKGRKRARENSRVPWALMLFMTVPFIVINQLKDPTSYYHQKGGVRVSGYKS
jgi:hypothetical protein